MLRYAKTKVAKEKIYGAKKTINIRHVKDDKVVVSKLVEKKLILSI